MMSDILLRREATRSGTPPGCESFVATVSGGCRFAQPPANFFEASGFVVTFASVGERRTRVANRAVRMARSALEMRILNACHRVEFIGW